jgi:transposase
MRTAHGSRERLARQQQGHVPIEHPLRRVRSALDLALGALHQWLYVSGASPPRYPLAPEQVVRALLLQFLFAIRRERQLVDQIWYSMLFRWFVGLRLDEPKWDLDVLGAYRLHLLTQDAIRQVLMRGLIEAQRVGLLTAEGLTARRCQLEQFAPEMTAGVGHPGVLPANEITPA